MTAKIIRLWSYQHERRIRIPRGDEVRVRAQIIRIRFARQRLRRPPAFPFGMLKPPAA